MRRLLFIGLVLLLLPVPAHAQTIGSYVFKIFNAGATNPLSTTNIPVASVQCNQTPTTSTNTTNPTDLWWTDPANVGRACHYVSQPTDPLITMPITGNPLEATLVAVSTTGLASVDSNRAPFTKPGTAPAAPTGFILR